MYLEVFLSAGLQMKRGKEKQADTMACRHGMPTWHADMARRRVLEDHLRILRVLEDQYTDVIHRRVLEDHDRNMTGHIRGIIFDVVKLVQPVQPVRLVQLVQPVQRSNRSNRSDRSNNQFNRFNEFNPSSPGIQGPAVRKKLRKYELELVWLSKYFRRSLH